MCLIFGKLKNICLKVKNNGRELNWSYGEVTSIVSEEVKKNLTEGNFCCRGIKRVILDDNADRDVRNASREIIMSVFG